MKDVLGNSNHGRDSLAVLLCIFMAQIRYTSNGLAWLASCVACGSCIWDWEVLVVLQPALTPGTRLITALSLVCPAVLLAQA
jgi:hypothetical protein